MARYLVRRSSAPARSMSRRTGPGKDQNLLSPRSLANEAIGGGTVFLSSMVSERFGTPGKGLEVSGLPAEPIAALAGYGLAVVVKGRAGSHIAAAARGVGYSYLARLGRDQGRESRAAAAAAGQPT